MALRARAVLRVRTGCLTCRARKKKCDEQKPRCRGCIRNHLNCHWPREETVSEEYELVTRGRVGEPTPARRATPRICDSDQQLVNVPDTTTPACNSPGLIEPHQSSPTTPSHDHLQPRQQEDETYDSSEDSEILSIAHVPHNQRGSVNGTQALQSITQNTSFFPGLDPVGFELLSYYMSKTANSMGNGSTDTNPFLTQLIPLAFSSQLVLHLILTQSAAQRAIEGPDAIRRVAQDYYIQSLRLFRAAVNDFISGCPTDSLLLAAGSLILCYIETAKGDTDGVIFDHLNAAQSVISSLSSSVSASLSSDLNDFLVEYYTYTVSTSMMSVDAQHSVEVFIPFDVERRAHQLVRSGHVGQISGCWLELLLIITRVFELGRTIPRGYDSSDPLTPDYVLQFSDLHHQIMSFIPSGPVSPEILAAGYVYQNALLLYLYTILSPTGISSSGDCRSKIDGFVEAATLQLSQVPPGDRVNTSLCWPLVIIGSCTDRADVQLVIRSRLQIMSHVVRLGNINEALAFLEHVWNIPLAQRSPWTLCRIMQECGIWVSFS